MSDLLDYLRGLSHVTEMYTRDNTALLRHLYDTGKFDPYRHWTSIADQAVDYDDVMDEFRRITGDEDLDLDALIEEDPAIFEQLPQEMQRELAERVIDYLAQHDPAELPSSHYLSLESMQLLPRQTWLVHFSDAASSIWRNGFKYGMDDMDRLGLTTYYTQGAKKSGGYNFAFTADSYYAQSAALNGKYGEKAVLFRNSGVHAYHGADEEDQIIFIGRDVSPSQIVYLDNDGGDYVVKTRRPLRDGRDYLFRGPFPDVVRWVMANYDRYRRVL